MMVGLAPLVNGISAHLTTKDSMKLCHTRGRQPETNVKYIEDEDPYYNINTKSSIFSFTWADLAVSSVQTKYNEGCSKLTYLLAEVE